MTLSPRIAHLCKAHQLVLDVLNQYSPRTPVRVFRTSELTPLLTPKELDEFSRDLVRNAVEHQVQEMTSLFVNLVGRP